MGFGELCKCNLQNMRVSRKRVILGATVIEASAIATITGPPVVSHGRPPKPAETSGLLALRRGLAQLEGLDNGLGGLSVVGGSHGQCSDCDEEQSGGGANTYEQTQAVQPARTRQVNTSEGKARISRGIPLIGCVATPTIGRLSPCPPPVPGW